MSKPHLEETVWAGSKNDEILLKDLITGQPVPSKDEQLDRDIPAMASLVEELAHNRPALLRNWMRAHPDSDFIKWLRTFENTGA